MLFLLYYIALVIFFGNKNILVQFILNHFLYFLSFLYFITLKLLSLLLFIIYF